jgi:hypothetical protein
MTARDLIIARLWAVIDRPYRRRWDIKGAALGSWERGRLLSQWGEEPLEELLT